MRSQDEHYMARALELAKGGLGSVSPNPLVGALLVAENDQVIGSGFHRCFGGPHAEIEAFRSVQPDRLHRLSEATLYVTLEPCSHFGKTPPCADEVISRRIRRVVAAVTDPNPKVSGKGLQRIAEAGILTEVGVLKERAEYLNRRFFTFMREGRPYVILKWAQTKDGFFAQTDRRPFWITGPESRELVHRWRAEEDAILIGTDTALYDNPALTVRLIAGKNPLRIVLDRNLRVPSTHTLFCDGLPTLLVTSQSLPQGRSHGQVEVLKLDFNQRVLPVLLSHLKARGIGSVLVEGGSRVLSSFIEQGLWDEARILTGEKKLSAGLQAPRLPALAQPEREYRSGIDLVREYTRL